MGASKRGSGFKPRRHGYVVQRQPAASSWGLRCISECLRSLEHECESKRLWSAIISFTTWWQCWCTEKAATLLTIHLCSMVSLQHMGGGLMTVNATAATIIKTVQSLYQANINRTLMTEQLVMAFFSQLSKLTGQPLNSETQHHWFKQLQAMQLQYRWLFTATIRLCHR